MPSPARVGAVPRGPALALALLLLAAQQHVTLWVGARQGGGVGRAHSGKLWEGAPGANGERLCPHHVHK